MLTSPIVDKKFKGVGISADDDFAEVSAPQSGSAFRNSPCPCASGKKLKNCGGLISGDVFQFLTTQYSKKSLESYTEFPAASGNIETTWCVDRLS